MTEKEQVELDPPSASSERLIQFGMAVARVAQASPYRVAIMAFSRWSHASLNHKEYKLIPDVTADKRLYEALMSRDHKLMRNMTDAEIDDASEQEARNWFCLAGEPWRSWGRKRSLKTWSKPICSTPQRSLPFTSEPMLF